VELQATDRPRLECGYWQAPFPAKRVSRA